MRITAILTLLFLSGTIRAQQPDVLLAKASAKWADSVYKTLSKDERIAQLMIVRLSAIDSRTGKVTFYDDKVEDLIQKYNVGGICVFQGSPQKQAIIINRLQTIARTPLMMCIDAEWGVGMRITDSVLPLPKQMMLGAMRDNTIVYKYGEIVAEQCKRIGLHVNYAPVVDINNNPDNPVINDRSFGEDKYKVADFGIAYMKGMQDRGVMATAKHFPGHGDVAVDSHYDLPVINKSLAQLDSLELYPFRQIFNAGVGSAMIAHLYIPAIDKSPNRATSLSKLNVTDLLRKKLNYQGLTFTDALEMQGVQKFFPGGSSSVESLIAGNDMLCLPGDVPSVIEKIKQAIKAKQLSWNDIEKHCKKVLAAKYAYGMAEVKMIDLNNLTADLNKDVPAMRKLVAENAITLLQNKDKAFFPLSNSDLNENVAYLGVGLKGDNAFAKRMRTDYNAAVFYLDLNSKDPVKEKKLLDSLSANFRKIVIGIHNMSRAPATNFGLGKSTIDIINKLQQTSVAITFVFGNAYAVKNFCSSNNLVLCYEDDEIIQNTAIDMLQGKTPYLGALPVTVCSAFKYGAGITNELSIYDPRSLFNMAKLNKIDSIVTDAIARKTIPGCVIMVAKDGNIVYEKEFGHYTYNKSEEVKKKSVYDLASVTKICATTISVMKLYDEGKIDLKKKLGDYLPSVRGSNKQNLSIQKILLHQAGLIAYIPFYREIIDSAGTPRDSLFSSVLNDTFNINVASGLYMRKDWRDTLFTRILTSRLGPEDKYVYSDNDFIYLGKIVEEVSGLPLDKYVDQHFYSPMGLSSTGFRPLEKMHDSLVVPTEDEKIFRRQLLRGYVHDPGAAMFGGVAGHAGLFSNARDLACIMQMLLNGGTFKGKNYLQPETIRLFTSYNADSSRRGFGFDKPEKDNATRKTPYPSSLVPGSAFGHTGYTGTATWADPENNLIYVFLGNRVNPVVNTEFLSLNVRGKIHDAIYEALKK